MRGESAATKASTARRLPVNKRRHRVAPENRKRVTTACNNCNVRRIRCSGEQPCLQCDRASRDCQYPAAVEKVSLPRSRLDDLQSECSALAKCLELLVPNTVQRQHLIARAAVGLPVDAAKAHGTVAQDGGQEDPDDAPTPSNDGRPSSDGDDTARDLESASGATFLDLVEEFITTTITLAWPGSAPATAGFSESLGRYRTHNSRPLSLSSDVEPTWLPGQTEMDAMLTQLRYFVQDGNGEYPSGGIFYWGDLDPAWAESSGELASFPHAGPTLSRLALYQTALALVCLLRSTPAHPANNTPHRGEAFFARARVLMGNPLDVAAGGCSSSVADLPVLALAALYLVELNRRDAASMYASVGMHIAVLHGVHQGRGGTGGDEQTKRAFWTLYVVDRWLSGVMGRPPSLMDDDIRLPLPEETRGLPPPYGLTAHVQLSRIAGFIVGDTYPVAPPSGQQRVPTAPTMTRIDEALGRLADWLAKLPPELRLDDNQVSRDKACCELYMGYNQLVIVALRPVFFAFLKKAVAERYNMSHDESRRGKPPTLSPAAAPLEKGGHMAQCLAAARRNMRLGRWVRDLAASRKLLVPALHHLFHAAIVLLLYQLATTTPDDDDAADVAFTVDCFDFEARGGGGGGHYPRNCARVLREISGLVLRLRARGTVVAIVVPHAPGTTTTTAYDVGFIINPEASSSSPSGATGPPPPTTMTDALHDELSAWLSYDDLHLYDNPSV